MKLDLNEALDRLKQAGASVSLNEAYEEEIKHKKTDAGKELMLLARYCIYQYYGRGQGDAMMTSEVYDKLTTSIGNFLKDFQNFAVECTKGN